MKPMAIFTLDHKNKKALILLSCLLVPMALVTTAFADYEISWFTIDNGGGTSSGGTYILIGTIGQPDTAYSSSGNSELLGGFWPGGPLCVVQFDDFARFAEQWLYTGSGLAGDLDGDNDVDLEDLRQFAENWLSCCPYNWPLK